MSDKEPKIIIDDDVLNDEYDAADTLDDESYGDDIIDDDANDWDVDDFDENFDLSDEPMDVEHTESSPGSSKKLLVYGVAILVAAGVGGFLYTQLMPNSQNNSMMMDNASVNASSQSPAEQLIAVNEAPSAEQQISAAIDDSKTSNTDNGSLLGDMSSLDDLLMKAEADNSSANASGELDDIFSALDTDPQGIPMPAPISTDIEDTPADIVMAADSGTTDEDPFALAANETGTETDMIPMMDEETAVNAPNLLPMPTADDALAMTEDMPIAQMADTAPLTMTSADTTPIMDSDPTTLGTENATEMTALTTNSDQMVLIEQRLNALTSNLESLAMAVEKISNQTPTVSENMTNSNASEAMLNQLEKTLSRLEKRVDTLAKQPKITTARATTPQKSTNRTTRNRNVSQTVSKRWVLRGALPGEAVVSRASDGSVLTIKTGEVLAGLGTIKSISRENNQWVVQGTQGRIIH